MPALISTTQKTNTIELNISEQQTEFHWRDGSNQIITIPVGFQHISERYFHHTPPTYDEIEYAINEIEDEIEKVVRQIPSQTHQIMTHDVFIQQLANSVGFAQPNPDILSRDALESLFGQYAEIAMGRPARSTESDISPTFYAHLLIFRELMHHLKFERVNFPEVQ